MISNDKQQYKGFFKYTNVDQDGLEFEETVNFIMDLEFNKGSFKGSTIDDETQNLFSDPIIVEGAIEDDMINFSVNYPNNYYFDPEKGELVVEKDKPYPGCEYLGSYNKDEDKYEGEWRLPVEQNGVSSSQDYSEVFDSGSWEMSKI